MDKFVKTAYQAASVVGSYLKKKVTKIKFIREKLGSFDVVTDADIEAQKIIIDIISSAFPSHQIIAEEKESNQSLTRKGYSWVIDPIDGTSAFASGLPTYCSSIALLKEGKPYVGAIYLALTDEIIYAKKGSGAYLDGHKLKVSSLNKFYNSSIGFDPSYFNRNLYLKNIAAPILPNIRIMPMLWSQATALALIARGNLDGYIQCNSPKIWDVAAGVLLVEEALGQVSDFKGKSFDIFHIDGYVASNRNLHKQILSYTSNFSLR